jgi:hypothetical protein
LLKKQATNEKANQQKFDDWLLSTAGVPQTRISGLDLILMQAI